MKIAIYPGTFDPITFGHLDIIKRVSILFDKLIIGVAKDNAKNPLFTTQERVELIKTEIASLDNVKNIEVESFEGLLVDFAKYKKSYILIRGLRAVSDFEYEFQMYGMNNKLNPELQTVFLPASESHHFIASKLVKEVAKLNGDISHFVSQNVIRELKKKLFQ
ncbi:MAG: pantetheine-phosphate adenylyltransferase [Rickettsiales bacterium]|nr:pantetheine-phosphate adenylyltransferase [Rickettsiales bacterium]